MKYDFSVFVDRRGTDCSKWDRLKEVFGREDILPLWVADSDWLTAPPIIEAIKARSEHGIFGYTKPGQEHAGIIIDWVKRRYGWEIKEEWITYSAGIVPALHVGVNVLSSPKDRVIIQSPVYRPFFNAARGGEDTEFLNNPLYFDGQRYQMDFLDLERKLSRRDVKAFILCNPHNPVGRVWTEDELVRLGELCLKHGVTILSDEIHADLIFDGYRHIPVASLSEEFAKNTITMISPSKTFNIAGLYTSVIIIPDEDLRQRFIAESTGKINSVNLFGLTALKAAYRDCDEWLEEQIKYLQGNMEFAVDYINSRIPGIKVHKPEGTYLLWLDCRGISEDPDELGRFMVEEAKVGLVNGEWFGSGGEGFMRLNIACPRSTLIEALTRIEKAARNKKEGWIDE